MTAGGRITALVLAVSLLAGLPGCADSKSAGGAEDYKWGNVAIGGGGYVTGMEYNPAEEGLVYARTDIGGLYRRRSGGSWEAITDFLGADDWNYIGIESVATDPVEPNRVYFAGGTYMNGKAGLFASSDYGDTWTRFDAPFGCGGNQSGRGCGERMAVDPKDNKNIWFGSRDAGLWHSADYGKSWTEVTAFPVKGNYKQENNSIGILWIEFAPESNDMYIGVAMTDGVCIYRSQDGGGSFSALPENAKGLYPLHGDFSADGRLYLAYADNCGPNLSPENGAVYVFDPEKDSFTDITPSLDDGRVGGFGGISADPQHPGTIVVSTLGWWSNDGDNLYYSTDGGSTWSSLFNLRKDTKNYSMDTAQAAWLDWGRGEGQAKTGWWIADVNFNPFNPDEVMYGTGATIYSTRNISKIDSEPVTIAFDAYGLEETATFKMVSPPSDGTTPQLYSIMGDLTGFAHMDVTVCPDDAHFMKNGKPMDVDCAFLNPNIAVYTSEEKGKQLTFTKDGGSTWDTVRHAPDPSPAGKVAMAADGSTCIWTPGSVSAKPYVTDDLGETWYYVDGLSYGAQIAADRVDPKLFYATCDGQFYISEDGGYSFKATGQMAAESAVPVSVVGQKGHVWMASASLIQFSEDGGKTFSPIKTLAQVDAIGFGKAKDENSYPVIFAEGDDGTNGYGIYKSEDKGSSWVRINDDQHLFGNMNPKYITGDSNVYGRVYFATDGRGIVMGDLANEQR